MPSLAIIVKGLLSAAVTTSSVIENTATMPPVFRY
jgi:hypothetical protein